MATLETRDLSIRDFNTAVEDFAKDLGEGYWRRVLTVVLLLVGVGFGTAGGILSTLPS